MGRVRGVVVAVAALGGFFSGLPTGAENRAAPYRRLVGGGDEAESVRGAVEGARQRFARKSCVGILDEFTDAAGRTLRSNLDSLALTPAEYIDHLVFYDAEGAGRCRSTRVLAMTTPGSRVVVVCGERFVKARRYDRRLTEVTVIHEALHTLGLGENPPSSSAITSRVFARCGQ